MRTVAVALLLLFSNSATAATFTYVPVHVAPVVHIPPPIHVQPMISPPVSSVRPGSTVVRPGPMVVRPTPTLERHHHVPKPLPVTVYNVPQNRKCPHPKPGDKGCAGK
jgi:hypothetical protein